MTLNDMPNDAIEPTEIETLLPWYVAGTLRRRDRQRVEAALRSAPELARKLELVREELAETIHFNETLGAPTPGVADRLMAAIDAEAGATRKRPGVAAGWLTGFLANLSPRTLAVATSLVALAIALQAVMIVEIFTKPPLGSIQQASLGAEQHHGNARNTGNTGNTGELERPRLAGVHFRFRAKGTTGSAPLPSGR